MALAPLPPRSGVKRPTEGVGVAVMKLKEGRSPLKPGGVCGGVLWHGVQALQVKTRKCFKIGVPKEGFGENPIKIRGQ